jgi:hypothetical protein
MAWLDPQAAPEWRTEWTLYQRWQWNNLTGLVAHHRFVVRSGTAAREH